MSQAISSKKETNAAGCLIAFFAIFAFAGLAVFVINFALPCIQVWGAQSWTPTPCLIQSSAVISRDNGDDLRYFPDILFAYSVNKQIYESNTFSFFKLSFANTYQPQSLLNSYPNGAAATCYVNPRNPSQAVLIRGIPAGAWHNLLALIFFGVGIAGIIWQILSRRAATRNEALGKKSWHPKNLATNRKSTPAVALDKSHNSPFKISTDRAASTTASVSTGATWQAANDGDASSPNANGDIVLKPAITPAATGCVLFFMAAFWNGIVGASLFHIVFNTSMGLIGIGVGLFLIPFVLIGLLLLFLALSSLGAIFITRPIFTANTASVPLGGNLELKWQARRGLITARQLTIVLEAREEATYTRGTDSYTDRNVFLSQPIYQSGAGEVRDGQSILVIPADAMHTFEAAHNKVVWAIKVRGDVPLWPTFEDEYRIMILPAASYPARPQEYSAVAPTPNTEPATQPFSTSDFSL